MDILLASASPRRKELISWLGLEFEVLVPVVDETIQDGEALSEYCSRLSREKAGSVRHERPDAVIIAADTVVVIGGELLEKPHDEQEAFDHLMLLQGAMHEVYTGYTIMHGAKSVTRVVRTNVYFRPMTPEEIVWYVSTGEPMDKAGSYGLQGIGSIFVDRIEGSYTNVIGLPLSDLYQDLKGFGLALHPIGEV